MMKLLIAGCLVSLATTASCHAGLDKRELIPVIACIDANAKALGAPLPRARLGEVWLKYHLGKYDFVYPNGTKASVGDDNELRLAVYGDDEQRVTIYNVYLERSEIELGWPAKFQKIDGSWEAGDNPGGIATDFFLRDLLKTLSARDPIKVPIHSVRGSVDVKKCSLLSN